MEDEGELVHGLVRRLRIIRQIQSAVWGGPQPVDTRLPIDDLVEIVQRDFECTIDVRLVPFKARHLVSLVERRAGRFLIAVREDAPLIERRFGTVKEICHIVGDQPEDYQPHGEKTLAGILKKDTYQLYDKTLDLGGEGRGVPSEKRAERMAEELLYDHRLRSTDAIRVKASQPTLPELANRYGISVGVATRVTRPLAMELMRDLWRESEA